MKKILVLFVLTAIAMVSVNAQDNLKWGVMAGMNVSKYTFTGFEKDWQGVYGDKGIRDLI